MKIPLEHKICLWRSNPAKPSKVLLKKTHVTVAQPGKKFHVFHGKQLFTAVFTKSCQLSPLKPRDELMSQRSLSSSGLLRGVRWFYTDVSDQIGSPEMSV